MAPRCGTWRGLLYTGSRSKPAPCQPGPQNNRCVPGVDGRLYAGFGVLPSVVVIPLLSAGEKTAEVTRRDPSLLSAMFVSFGSLLAGALDPSLHGLWLTTLGFSWMPSAATGLLTFFGTVLWHHSVKGFYSEPYFALALIGAAYLLKASRGDAGVILAGFLFGCSLACRVFGAIFAPLFAFYCFAVPEFGVMEDPASANGSLCARRSRTGRRGCMGELRPIWKPVQDGLPPGVSDRHVPAVERTRSADCEMSSSMARWGSSGSLRGSWSCHSPGSNFGRGGPSSARCRLRCCSRAFFSLPRMSPGTAAGRTGHGCCSRVYRLWRCRWSRFLKKGIPASTAARVGHGARRVVSGRSDRRNGVPDGTLLPDRELSRPPARAGAVGPLASGCGIRGLAAGDPRLLESADHGKAGAPGNTPSEESRAVVMTAAQYLASFPNSINFTQPDLWLVKAARLGLPSAAIALAVAHPPGRRDLSGRLEFG